MMSRQDHEDLKSIPYKQTDPDGKDPHELGSKLDAGKRKLYTHLITYFPRALEEVCLVSEEGARKYTRNGWKYVDNGEERYADATLRHIFAEAKGELKDQELDLYHAAQEAWNALAKLELILMEKEGVDLNVEKAS